MSPSDSRPGRSAVINSHSPLVQTQALSLGHPDGSLRFLVDLSTPAALNHPGESGRCKCSLLHGRFRASPLLEGWPLPISFNEAESGSLALRLTSSRLQASVVGSPPSPLDRLHGERAITMVSTFQLTRSTTSLIHQKENQGNEEYEHARIDTRRRRTGEAVCAATDDHFISLMKYWTLVVGDRGAHQGFLRFAMFGVDGLGCPTSKTGEADVVNGWACAAFAFIAFSLTNHAAARAPACVGVPPSGGCLRY